MRIRSHSESHIVELDDGSRWQIFPGDLDLTLDWTPETELSVVPIDNEFSSHALIDSNRGKTRRRRVAKTNYQPKTSAKPQSTSPMKRTRKRKEPSTVP